jgi:1-acyl-sn-glycerol-3-phosphate acyltransferase
VKAERPEDRLPIKLLRAGNVLFTRLYHHLDVQTPSRFPYRGPGILVCNHVSGLDPLLIQAPCNRLITWMMAAEYYQIRSIAWIFRTVGAIPVQRSGRDMAATRAAMRALDDGAILGVFPEGRIATTRDLLPFQTGVALMALKTGVPVYPAYIDGSQRGKEMLDAFLTPNRAVLRFGPPVQLGDLTTSRQGLDQATERVRDAIISLQREALKSGMKCRTEKK